MPTIQSLLQEKDLFFLQNLARFWGIELSAPDDSVAKLSLAETMDDNKELLLDLLDLLPEDAKSAFQTILESGGQIAWSKFSRSFGDVRIMGTAKQERERPDLNPISTAEKLWYRGLIGRAFLNINDEPQEYVYIPEEFLKLVKSQIRNTDRVRLNPISNEYVEIKNNANDKILQDACTLLAGLRKGLPESEIQSFLLGIPYRFLYDLLEAAKIIKPDGLIDPEATRLFLESTQKVALSFLYQSWQESNQINDIHYVTEFVVENRLENNSKRIRLFLLENIFELEPTTWFTQNSFVKKIKRENPDFLRPAGNFDTWFVKSTSSNDYLMGYDHWDDVDGNFIVFMLNGPLNWLGIIESGELIQGKTSTFRISTWGKDLWNKNLPDTKIQIDEKPKIDRFGRIGVSKKVSLALRYQISRFCEWEKANEKEFVYRITTKAFLEAEKQGLKPNHLLSLLQKSIGLVSPQIKLAIENWENNGTEIVIRKEILLQVKNPEIITKLQKSAEAKFIKEIISPTTVVIIHGSENKIINSIIELGYLTDWKID